MKRGGGGRSSSLLLLLFVLLFVRWLHQCPTTTNIYCLSFLTVPQPATTSSHHDEHEHQQPTHLALERSINAPGFTPGSQDTTVPSMGHSHEPTMSSLRRSGGTGFPLFSRAALSRARVADKNEYSRSLSPRRTSFPTPTSRRVTVIGKGSSAGNDNGVASPIVVAVAVVVLFTCLQKWDSKNEMKKTKREME